MTRAITIAAAFLALLMVGNITAGLSAVSTGEVVFRD